MYSRKYLIAVILLGWSVFYAGAQSNATWSDSTTLQPQAINIDSTPQIYFREVNIVSFKTAAEWMEYYKYKSRIIKVLPYLKIAKELYAEIKEEKRSSKRREYRRYKKDLEKEMRARFENELKDLTIGQGEMLFKLINRETGNNAYYIIKDLKGPFHAWFYQMVARRWGYNLKENYNPNQEKMIELIIRELGPAYRV